MSDDPHSSAIVVRPARIEETEGVLAGYGWLFAPPGSTPPGWEPVVAAERIKSTIEGDDCTMLVAVDRERIVGICSAYMDLLSVRYGLRCWVEDLAVDPDYRSRGVGSGLLAAALEFARSRGGSHLELDSGDARTDAHRFYEREGAKVLSRAFGWHGLG